MNYCITYWPCYTRHDQNDQQRWWSAWSSNEAVLYLAPINRLVVDVIEHRTPAYGKTTKRFLHLKNIQEQMKLTVTFTYWSRIKCIHVIMNAKFRVLITFLTIDDEIQ